MRPPAIAVENDRDVLRLGERSQFALEVIHVDALEEMAGGGDLDELRSQLVGVQLVENPPGIDEALLDVIDEQPEYEPGAPGTVTVDLAPGADKDEVRANVDAALAYFTTLKANGRDADIARDILPEIRERLKFLSEVGLGYLALDLPTTLVAIVLVVGAFSTGLPYLFYLVYLGLLVGGGAYILTRLGLSDLEAGYAVDRLAGHVGDELRITYTVRNVGWLPKLWLEVHNPTDLPNGLPGRAIGLGGRTERSWLIRLPLARRGTFRVEALRIRAADPFGLFEAAASVGEGTEVTIYPRIEPLPYWRLPAASLEGSHSAPERTIQTTALATTVRPWAPGDAFNRIHWRSTARHGELQVKEFELERTADVWLVLDLEDLVQQGEGERSTIEVGVRTTASIAAKALAENRSVGLGLNASHASLLPSDRGGRQRLKVMQLLSAVDGDGEEPLVELIRRLQGTSLATTPIPGMWDKGPDGAIRRTPPSSGVSATSRRSAATPPAPAPTTRRASRTTRISRS